MPSGEACARITRIALSVVSLQPAAHRVAGWRQLAPPRGAQPPLRMRHCPLPCRAMLCTVTPGMMRGAPVQRVFRSVHSNRAFTAIDSAINISVLGNLGTRFLVRRRLALRRLLRHSQTRQRQRTVLRD